MKLKDVLHQVRNSRNGQTVWNPKKRKLKSLKVSEEQILNMNMDSLFKRGMY